jgi:hypothetical protein
MATHNDGNDKSPAPADPSDGSSEEFIPGPDSGLRNPPSAIERGLKERLMHCMSRASLKLKSEGSPAKSRAERVVRTGGGHLYRTLHGVHDGSTRRQG